MKYHCFDCRYIWDVGISLATYELTDCPGCGLQRPMHKKSNILHIYVYTKSTGVYLGKRSHWVWHREMYYVRYGMMEKKALGESMCS